MVLLGYSEEGPCLSTVVTMWCHTVVSAVDVQDSSVSTVPHDGKYQSTSFLNTAA